MTRCVGALSYNKKIRKQNVKVKVKTSSSKEGKGQEKLRIETESYGTENLSDLASECTE